MVNKPSEMSEDEAPANAYLQAVPTCTAGFVYTCMVKGHHTCMSNTM